MSASYNVDGIRNSEEKLDEDNDLIIKSIIWIDAQINTTEENQRAQHELRSAFDSIKILVFEQVSECEQYLQQHINEPTVIIVSGKFAQILTPEFYDITSIESVYIYCRNTAWSTSSINEFTKYRGIFNEFNQLVSKIQLDRKQIEQSRYSPTTFTFSFNNNGDSSLIIDGDILQFRHDIYDQLIEFRKLQAKVPIETYRGQLLSVEELSIWEQSVNRLVLMKSFFSTTVNRDLALFILGDAAQNSDRWRVESITSLKRVLFIISADPSSIDNDMPFADIGLKSNFPEEEETLFMAGSIFRILDTHYDDKEKIHMINLQLCTIDIETNTLLTHAATHLGNDNSSITLGHVLLDIGRFDLAETCYINALHKMLNQKNIQYDQRNIAVCYHSLGNIAQLKDEYEKSLEWYKKGLEKYQELLPANHDFIADSYRSIGAIYGRMGTTLLYNLLACDPNCRAPLYTDMMIDVVPPIARSDSIEQKRRIDILYSSSQESEQLTNILIQTAASHPHFPIEEDCHILRQAGYFPLFTLLSDDEDSNAESWIRNEMNKSYAYDYHETFVRMLNSVDAPKSHWLLKTQFHVFYLDELLRHYPNALLIMTHRSLDEVLPSWCSLLMAAANGQFNATNSISRDRITKRCCQNMDKSIECIMKFRTCQNGEVDQSRKNMLDITYDNLMKNPIGVVHQIYDYFNLQWSNEFEKAMHNWLMENPQGKQGRHKYTLSEFGFNREDIQARYADYTNLFLCSTFSDNQSPSTN
ncbi:unnamed protein product [Rotaria sp. Silwood1]|nr:unnamed protein product [Rotaria sp. Silwood1]